MSRFPRPFLLLCACASVLLFAAGAQAAVFTVGPAGSGCSHASLQLAINAASANGPGEDEIRVVSGSYTNQQLSITGQSLVVSGGWSNCSANSTVTGTTTLIAGSQAGFSGTNAVIRAQTADGNYQTLTLQRLVLRDGAGGPDGSGGGIDAAGAIRIVLQSVEVMENHVTANGGGISLQAPTSGFGGILELHAGTKVHHNSAGNYGGGIFLDRATARIRADRTEIADNVALSGGGITALGGSVSIGNTGEPEIQTDATGSRIVRNRAQQGGGVYLDRSALFSANELQLSFNLASKYGGGLYAIGNAQVQIQRDYLNAFVVQCQGAACSRLEGNQAGNGCPGSDGYGGAMYLDGARAYLSQVEIVDNCAYGDPAIESWGPLLRMEGVLVAGNRLRWREGANYTGRQAVGFASRVGGADSTSRVAFTTFGRNLEVKPDGATLPANATSGISTGGQWTHALFAVASSDPMPIAGSMNNYGACNRLASIADFANADGGDFRPAPNGALVDACTAEEASPEYRDALLTTRCLDHQRPNQGGTCDIGAYELAPMAVPADRIFASGFEQYVGF